MPIQTISDGVYVHEGTGFILHQYNPKNFVSTGAVFLVSSKNPDYFVAVGGTTLLQLIAQLGVKTPNDLRRVVIDFVQSGSLQLHWMKSGGTSSLDTITEEQKTLFGEIDQMYAIRTNVADMLIVGKGAPNSVYAYVRVDVISNDTYAQVIDKFYSGIPKQSEPEVVAAINKAKRQVVNYLNGKHKINLSKKLPVPLILNWRPEAKSWAVCGRFYTPIPSRHADSKAQEFRVHSYHFDGVVLDRYHPSPLLSLNRPASSLNGLTTFDQFEADMQADTQTHGLMILINSILGVPLSQQLGGLAGAHTSQIGGYNGPGEDFTEARIQQYLLKDTKVLNDEVLVRLPNETEADFLARQNASKQIIEQLEWNLLASSSGLTAISFPFITELCDRALIGGPLLKGNPSKYTGTAKLRSLDAAPFSGADVLAHDFEKSY